MQKIYNWLGCGFAIVFILGGLGKLFGLPMLVAEFDQVGLGQWFRYFVGCWEILSAILFFIPARRHLGALLMLLTSIGAFVAQVTRIHQDWIHAVLFVVVTGFLVYHDRGRIAADLKRLA